MKTRVLFTTIIVAASLSVGRAHAQSPPPPPTIADVKMLAKGGVSQEVILSQLRNSHAIYHLNTADILDLKDNGVSEPVIDFMINTANNSPAAPPPPVAQQAPPAGWPPPPPPTVSQEAVVGSDPPPAIVEQVVVSPGPGYTWIAGYWTWRHGHWEWIRGYWALPPRRESIWIGGHWEHHGYRVVWVDGYWR